MKKHILFIVENSTVPFDLRVWAEAKSLKEFGYDISIITPIKLNGKLKYENIDGIDVYRHPMPLEAEGKFAFIFEYLNALFWEFFLSIKLFVKKPFHVIHAANPPDHVFIIALIFKLLGVKFVFDHHDICPENYLAKFDRKDFLYNMLLIMEKLTFKSATIVISTNESYKKIAIERGSVKEKNVYVVRNGPDLSRVQYVPPNPKLKEGFNYLVSYVGVIGKQEGIENLLNSVHYIVHEKGIADIKFIVIGTGPHWNELVALSESMRLEKFITFTGFIPYRDFYEILATSDLCVNPEFKNDFTDKSTMWKIMDYMIFGKPIVQYNTVEGKNTAGNSAMYIMDNNEIQFAEGVLTLLSDSKRRKQMGRIGRERIHSKLSWDFQKVNLKNAYDFLENSA